MTGIVWPADLPQDVTFDGYSEQAPNVLLRTSVDAGPPKQRRRYTAGIRPITFNLELTRDQAALLDSFFMGTLSGGALSFEWVHPRTQESCTMRFTQPYTIAPVSQAVWKATCKVEIMP